MSSYSSIDNALVLEALEHYDFSGLAHLCDVGGGHGLTLCSLLVQYPHLRGTVLELPSVIARPELLLATKMGVGDRCTYVPGDMFREVPPADAYMVKRILHGRVLIMEEVVPGPETPHFSKLFDMHMLIMLTGKERTLEEYAGLLEGAGWKYRQTWYLLPRCWGW